MKPNRKLTLALIRFAAFVAAVAGACLLGVSLYADIFLEMSRSPILKFALPGLGLSCAAVVITRKWVDYAIQMPRPRLVGCLANLFNLILIVFGTVIAAAVVANFLAYSADSGAAVRKGAILMEQGPYFLNNHGKISEVSRDVFLEKAFSSTLIWHCQFMLIPLGVIYTVTFKSLPWPLSTKTMPPANH